ncbi:filamentous hemagglutinin N-terminal domain-containing protein [Pseudomonas sp. NFXW11]|uniref:two-partner secretion domain-containing protein n=1 Tax=Pseudomonas sp. NFXW11 TaxID=2819531 RepID=UPI003CF8AFEB
MNRIYAVVWNRAQGCWNVAHEGVRRRRGGATSKGLAGVLGLVALAPALALALPEGATLVSGSASYEVADDHMVINQHSDKLITHWNEFSVGRDQAVTFNQPGRDAIALNRVTGFRTSQIHGAINANGQVFLINPNGVVFGQGASVNVGGLVASTRDLADEDFQAGRYRFSGESTAEVVNSGQLTSQDGGYVALLGARVHNNGQIHAPEGTVALAAGKQMTLSLGADGLLNVQVDAASANALVQNSALLKADGGQVSMQARSSNALADMVVNQHGVIEANSLSSKGGRIILDGGEQGLVQVAGQLTAKVQEGEGDGGSVLTRGAATQVALTTEVDTRSANGRTGTWTIESDNLRVAATGASGDSTLVNSTLADNLGTTHVHLDSRQGDLAVDAPVQWNSGNQLTLSAARDVKVKGRVEASGRGARLQLAAGRNVQLGEQVSLTGAGSSLGLNHGEQLQLGSQGRVTLSGQGAGFDANGQQYQVVQSKRQLQAIGDQLDGFYVLGNQLKGSGALKPIGGDSLFSGTFNGLGNTISGFTLDSSGAFAGLFGRSSGSISNLKLDSLTVNGWRSASGFNEIGGLVGRNSGSISNVTASHLAVNALSDQSNKLGGLVGVNNGGEISDSSMSGWLYGGLFTSAIGGLVGENIVGAFGVAPISGSSSNVQITTHMHKQTMGGAGGLVGVNNGGVISASSSRGSIGTNMLFFKGLNLGGLVGNNQKGSISGSNSSVTVYGSLGSSAGGLVGLNHSGSIRDSSASGAVFGLGTAAAGGLVGVNQAGSSLSNVQARGRVTDLIGGHLGGLVGKNENSSIDGRVEAQGAVQGGIGSNVGGLVGTHIGGLIHDAKAYGAVRSLGSSQVGGLVGYNDGDLIKVHAHGNVQGGAYSSVGGLVGFNANYVDHVIRDARSTGDVYGAWHSKVGGLVGVNHSQIVNSASSGRVSGGWRTTLGGLVGLNFGAVRDSSATGRVDGRWYYFQTRGSQIGINHGH